VSSARIERHLTARMRCERLRREHAAELSRLLRDPRVGRWLWPTVEPPSENDLLGSVGAMLAHWEHHGFGPWLLRDRITDELVGRGGLQYTQVAERDEVEVGWTIVPERWGQGLATELALTAARVAFGELGLRQIVAFTLPHNLASRRVMEKAGFRYEREIEHAGLPHVLYRRMADR
jgi:RimJ/RimL family protein N-acetyltransferase